MTWPNSATPLPTQWTSSERVTAVKMDARVDTQLNALQDFVQAPPIQQILFAPAGNSDTPSSGSATWVTLGTLSVPSWATQCWVMYTMNQFFDSATTSNTTVSMRLGTVGGGVTKRLVTASSQRVNQALADHFTGLTGGSTPSVTLFAAWTAGSVIRADTQSYFTALAFFSQ